MDLYAWKETREQEHKEIDVLIGHGDIVSFVKFLRIRWLGYVKRMNNNRMDKMIINAKMEGGRRRRRPRKRWLDVVEREIKSSGTRYWRLEARNRLEWRAVVREAKVHFNTGL
jgi:hypothetical protein